MNPNLLELAKGLLTGDTIQKYGAYVGESPENTRRAFGSAVPAVLAGFVNHASRSSSDPTSSGFMSQLAEGQNDGSMLDQLPAVVGGGAKTDAIVRKGEGMLGSLFGDRLPAAVDQIAGSSGVSKGSATKILGLAVPLMAAMVGREAKTRGLGGMGVANMLIGQKSSVDSALASSRLDNLFSEKPGWSKEADLRTTAGRGPTGTPVERRRGLPLVLLAVAALVALLFLFRGRRPAAPTVPEAPKIGRVEAPKAPHVFGGGPIDPADQLKRFFADPNAHVPKRVVLDGVFFSPTSMALSPTAQASLDPIATALKQDPKAKVRVEAFTDATGDATNDQRLSTQRAYSVRDVLVQDGIDPSRISVAGYGSERPIAPADTPEGRARNARIELVVTDR